jgi:hypothetical protein
MARHRLQQRRQTQSESFDNFVKDLKLIIMDCEYQNREDILVDCIIAGVREGSLQERMLLKGEDLTLAQAIELGQQHELGRQQMKQYH